MILQGDKRHLKPQQLVYKLNIYHLQSYLL